MGAFGRGSAVGLLRVLLVASLGVPLLLFAADTWLGYRMIFLEAARESARVCDVAAEHAAKVFNSHDLVARRVEDFLVELGDDAIRQGERELHDALVAMVVGLPQVGSFVVLDHTGRLLAATGAYPVSQTIDFSDRDYFVALESGKANTFLSKVQTSRVNGSLFFGFTRRLQTPTDGFRGIVSIAVSPQFFVNFWEALNGGAESAAQGRMVALVREDGQILSSWPPSSETAPDATGVAFTDATARTPNHGVFSDGPVLGTGDAVWRYAYCRVQGYPAYAVSGRSRDALRLVWAGRIATDLAVGIPATLALWLITWTALRRTRREEAALARMGAEMQRREAAETALMQAQRMEAVGQLTGGVAHDFNNLLTIMLSNFEMIGRDPQRHERVLRMAQAGMAAAQRGAELTAKLLAFSRRRMIRPEVVDINQLLREFRPVLRQGVTEAIALPFDLAPDLAPAALDPGQLEAAVLNLVANARDAMGDGGTIRVQTTNVVLKASDLAERGGVAPGPFVRVAVVDNGPGMEPAVASRAFEPFFTTKAVGRGTGLGLSQVYGFCQQAGGFARIRSAPGQGTTVELLLPRANRAPGGRAPAATRVSVPDAAGQVVLVVEDDAAVLNVAVANLTDLGYVTVTATTAAAGLELMRADARIRILFSDVVLPGGRDGVQLANAARQLRPGLRVVLASGYPVPEAARSIPPDAVMLSKPYTRDELAAALANK